jgi:hypothetical protein
MLPSGEAMANWRTRKPQVARTNYFDLAGCIGGGPTIGQLLNYFFSVRR